MNKQQNKTEFIQCSEAMSENETAWAFCRECDKFDMNGTGVCTGTPMEWEITDGNLPCENYNYKELT